jgi:hypothetical protein
MKTLYSAELWNRGSFNSRYITPMGLVEDLSCIDQTYLWPSKEDAHRAALEEAKTWYDPWGVQVAINEHEVGDE